MNIFSTKIPRFAIRFAILSVIAAGSMPLSAGGGESENVQAGDEARLKNMYGEIVARVDRPAEDVIVPIECYDDGAVKTDVTAARAQFFDREGLVWCGDVTVRQYDTDGSVKLELAAKGCLFDRKTRSGWLDGQAAGRFGSTVMSGNGIFFSYKDELVRITSDVSIVSTDIKFEGVKL